MRPRVIVAIVLIGSAFLCLLLMVKRGAGNSNLETAQRTVEAMETLRFAETLKASARTQRAPASGHDAIGDSQILAGNENSATAQHQEYVEKRIEELMDLGMKDDAASLDIILSELTNRDPDIRKAAVQAAIQFGSRDAIPKLTDAASQTDDAKEKAEIIDAIEFLKLPSATEVIAQSGGVKTPAKKNPLLKTQNPAASTPTVPAPR